MDFDNIKEGMYFKYINKKTNFNSKLLVLKKQGGLIKPLMILKYTKDQYYVLDEMSEENWYDSSWSKMDNKRIFEEDAKETIKELFTLRKDI
jgi:hypothetical protein